MALPSQVSDGGSRGRHMTSRRRRRRARWPWLVLLLLVALGVLYVGLWPRRGEQEGLDMASPAAAQADVTPSRLEAAPPADLETDAVPAPPPPAAEHRIEGQPAAVTPPAAAPPRDDRAMNDVPARLPPVADEAPAQTPGPAPVEPVAPSVARRLLEGRRSIAAGRLLEGRQVLSELLWEQGARMPASEADALRRTLADLNQRLFFTRRVVADDPLAAEYTIRRGDALSRVAPKFGVTDQLIALVNGLPNPNVIRAGQRIKVPRGPFHAVVSKARFRMDVYGRASDGRVHFVRSFPVGLGEDDSTPPGRWLVEPGRKLMNPPWINPRTREPFAADDPKNPIGERWIGLVGTEDRTRDKMGYGIHGTIEPQSIGKARSMGCIRMLPADVEVVYMLLVEGKSVVEIRQ